MLHLAVALRNKWSFGTGDLTTFMLMFGDGKKKETLERVDSTCKHERKMWILVASIQGPIEMKKHTFETRFDNR